MNHFGQAQAIVTVRLRSYQAAMTLISNGNAQEVGRWKNNDYDNSHLPF